MTATDPYAHSTPGLSSPCTRAEAVTPHDSNELTRVCRCLWIGTAGTITVVTVGGDTVTHTVADNTRLDLRCRQVRATDTSATNIVAWS